MDFTIGLENSTCELNCKKIYNFRKKIFLFTKKKVSKVVNKNSKHCAKQKNLFKFILKNFNTEIKKCSNRLRIR